MHISGKSTAAFFTVLSFAPAACFICLTPGAYAGPINTTTLCGNAQYCLFDSNNYSTPMTAEQAFVAAVGSNPLGQQNFGSYSAGTYPFGVGPLQSLATEGSGIGEEPLSVITGGPVGGGTDVGGSGGIALGLGGLYYYGYSYAETGRNTSDVGIAPGLASLGTLTLASSGFFGIVSSTPLSSNEGAIQLTGAGSGPTYIDDILYAGAPGISASNPLYPDSEECTVGGPTEIQCYYGVIVELGYLFFLDPAIANEYMYQTLDGSLFTSVGGFPTGFAGPFDVSSDGTDFGLFYPGQMLAFPNGGVTSFTISGINPAVDGSSPTAFPVELGLNTVGASIELIASDQSASIPEPSSYLLCIVGVIFAGNRLQKLGECRQK